MKTPLKTIFSKLPIRTSEQAENKKISYWLERLFNQEKERVEEKEKILKAQSELQSKANSAINRMSSYGKEEKQSSEEKGLEDAVENLSRKVELDRQKLKDMVASSNRILLSISSVFPLDIFPNIINVEATRITIITRQLFTSQVRSVDVKNISNVFIDLGFLFATLTIVSDTFIENEIKINNLWRKEAILARRIIEGLRMFVKEDIDTTNYTVEELISKLKELSTTKIVL